MNLKPLGAAFLVPALFLVGIGSTMNGWAFGRALELSHKRFYAIGAAIRQTPDPVIVFGDSIVEGAPLPKMLCGHAIVNAGVTGAAVQYFERHAAELLGSSRPRLIVLAVGINNASPAAGKQFRAHYHKTVAALSRTAAVAVATITPVRDGDASASYEAELIPIFNKAIKSTPNVKGVIDLNEPLSGANWTTDGIHFGQQGYALWSKAMVEGVSNALGCHHP